MLIALGIIILMAGAYVGYNYYFGSNSDNLADNNGTNDGGSSRLTNNTYDCSADIYNCANFTTQTQAQQVYDYCKSLGKGDINRLDADGNGKACEGLT